MGGRVQIGSTRPRVIVMMENLVEWSSAAETEVLAENLTSATLSTTNPTWEQTRARTRAAAVGSQRLTASAMARPSVCYYLPLTNTNQYEATWVKIYNIITNKTLRKEKLYI
jgi:hypothetical protein